MKKLRVGILFGGKSAEHEVSIQSARNVLATLDPARYETVLIGIDKKGNWFLDERCRELLRDAAADATASLPDSEESVALVARSGTGSLVKTTGGAGPDVGGIDVVFPVLHGPYGEDGSLQGLLKQANVPFVGAGVLGSAVAMDKDVMKRLFRDAGIPSPRFVGIHRSQRSSARFSDIAGQLGTPVFVKPANLGSSVGISKVADEESFEQALDDAFSYDLKVVVEESIKGRELECSVLGGDDPIASVPGEVVAHHDFYSYEAKYLDENGAALIIPADLPDATVDAIQELSIRAFQVLCCEGMARVDYFLQDDGKLYVNEINTIPGFTRISMYPKLWEASGISPSDLVDRLIELAIERHGREQGLKTNR